MVDSFVVYTLFFLASLLVGSLAYALPSRVLDVVPYTVIVLVLSTGIFSGLKSIDAFPDVIQEQL